MEKNTKKAIKEEPIDYSQGFCSDSGIDAVTERLITDKHRLMQYYNVHRLLESHLCAIHEDERHIYPQSTIDAMNNVVAAMYDLRLYIRDGERHLQQMLTFRDRKDFEEVMSDIHDKAKCFSSPDGMAFDYRDVDAFISNNEHLVPRE